MEPRIKILNERKLVGMFASMSLAENKTFKLFSAFMPRRKEILDSINNDVLGEKYQRKNPGAEQEIWIPIKLKNKVSH